METEELLHLAENKGNLTHLEIELAQRLRIARDEIDDLLKDLDDARGQS